MKILFVVNNYFIKGNGLSASARRTVEGLRAAGQEVRVLSCANPEEGGPQPEYLLPGYKVPVFDGLIRRQGYSFAEADEAVIRAAVGWADVVHLEEPFELQIKVCRLAEKMGVPCTATYHMHPENLFSSIHLRKGMINRATLFYWRNMIYNHCRIVQCPTENVRMRLKNWRFTAELRVISNGIPNAGSRPARKMRARKSEKAYTVVTTGRYSVEKDQLTLLRAMRYAASAPRIKLYLLGRGPMEKRLRRLAKRLVSEGYLRYPPVFRFCTERELNEIYTHTDLYVHCATVEVEGLGCTEAISKGVVPVIASGKLTATAQFAFTEKNIFPARNPRALAERIDWWLSHDEERRAESKKYLGLEDDYALEKSIDQLVRLFEDCLSDAAMAPLMKG